MRKTSRFCQTCWLTRDADLYWITVLVVISMTVASGGDVLRAMSVPVAAVIGLLVHELGHVLSAAACGFPVEKLQLGGGRPLLETRIGQMEVVVARRLTRGFTLYRAVDGRGLRARMLAVDLAGAAANVALAVAAVRWAPSRLGLPFAVMNGYFAFTALWPFFHGRHNDGQNFVERVFCPRWMIDYAVLYPQLEATAQHTAAGELDQALAVAEEALRFRPGSPVSLANHGSVLIELGRVEEARRIYLELLEVPRLKRMLPNVLNNLACADLLLGDPALLTEADEASARALAGREVAAYLDTRAWALIETGQIAAGTRLAQRALTYSTGRQRAHTQCILALAAARSGDPDRAEGLLGAAAEVLPPHDPVLCRIRAGFAAAPASV